MSLLFALLILILFTAMAFWQRKTILFIISAAVSLIAGFYCYDYFVNPLGMTMALALLAYCFFCLGEAYYIIARRREEED